MKLIMESRMKYFPEENYEKFLRLQRAVKTAEELDECVGGSGGGGGGGAGGDTCDSLNKVGERNGNIPGCPSSARSLHDWTKSADYPSRDHSIKDGLGQARLQLGRKHRRITSASETTIASRNKIRPEPKFQKVVTSQVFSRMRKGSRLISKNPERFLQEMVDGRGTMGGPASKHFCDTDSFATLLSSFNKDPSTDSYRNTLENLQEKCKQTKSRALLLNLGANPAIRSKLSERSASSSARSSVVDDFSSYFAGETGNGSSSPELLTSLGGGDNADFVLQSFLDEIRGANVDNITTWVRSVATLNDFELPFGLPSTGVLKIPIGNLQEGLSQFSRCSVEFIKSGLEEFFLLDAEYHAKLEELVTKITDNFRELEQAAWGEKDSALLFYLMDLTGQSAAHFSTEKLCTEVASRIFPFYGREDIIAQKYRLKVKKALEEKRNCLIKQWLKDKETLVKKVNSAWDDIQKKERLQQDFQNERRVQQEKCQYWMDLLEKMRKENRKRVRAVQTLVEPLEEELKNRQDIKDRQEYNRRLQQKELLEKFQRLRIESKVEQKKRQEEIQAALEKDKKIRQIHNRTRVHLRKKEYEQKMETMKELERKREEDRQARLEILEKTKEKVEIPYNPANVLSDTHASFVRSIEIQQLIQFQDGDAQKAVKFFQERYSFSAETLWKDSRVRLEAKLREAGLIDNSYARHVLLAMQPKEKPHLLSQIKFDDD